MSHAAVVSLAKRQMVEESRRKRAREKITKAPKPRIQKTTPAFTDQMSDSMEVDHLRHYSDPPNVNSRDYALSSPPKPIYRGDESSESLTNNHTTIPSTYHQTSADSNALLSSPKEDEEDPFAQFRSPSQRKSRGSEDDESIDQLISSIGRGRSRALLNDVPSLSFV